MSLTTNEIKTMLQTWHFYKAACLSSEDGGKLKKEVDAIEAYINALEEQSSEIMRLRFFECVPVEKIARKKHMTRQAVYKRIDASIKLIARFVRQSSA